MNFKGKHDYFYFLNITQSTEFSVSLSLIVYSPGNTFFSCRNSSYVSYRFRCQNDNSPFINILEKECVILVSIFLISIH